MEVLGRRIAYWAILASRALFPCQRSRLPNEASIGMCKAGLLSNISYMQASLLAGYISYRTALYHQTSTLPEHRRLLALQPRQPFRECVTFRPAARFFDTSDIVVSWFNVPFAGILDTA